MNYIDRVWIGDMSSASEERSNPVVRLLVSIRSSFVNFIMALGVALFLLGLAVSGESSGIYAVLGISAVIYGLVGELALRAIGYK